MHCKALHTRALIPTPSADQAAYLSRCAITQAGLGEQKLWTLSKLTYTLNPKP